ncbi:hypothetical protein [Cyclobacterium xiamenense]|uniref:hypothetical protein n=1 Tax=Cyclobacterium xiamenense TaxID=1297121 RepID=UPI0011600A2F|nr:hypothetical protein [Cyclobacterium xiamenense]
MKKIPHGSMGSGARVGDAKKPRHTTVESPVFKQLFSFHSLSNFSAKSLNYEKDNTFPLSNDGSFTFSWPTTSG